MKIVSLSRIGLLGLAALFSVSLSTTLPAQSRPATGSKPGAGAPPAMPPEVQKAAEQYSRAVGFDKAHKWAEAVPAYEEFLKLAAAAHLPVRNLLEVNSRLAFLYQTRGDSKNFEAVLQRMVALDPKNPTILVQIATYYSQNSKFAQAKQVATRVLTLSPKPNIAALAHHVLGAIDMVQQKPAEAEKEFSQAIQLAPRNPQGYLDYAYALVQRKKNPEALAAAQKAANLAPTMVQPKLFIGGIYQEQNRLPEALAKYDDVLRAEPKNPIALYNRAVVLHRQGNAQDAISAYLSVLNVAPTSFDAHYNVAQLYYAISNFGAARVHFMQAHNLAPKEPRTLASLALTEQKEATRLLDPSQRKNEYGLAESHYREAVALAPKDRSLQFGIASLYEDMGRYDDAVGIYRKYVADSPKDIESYRRLAQVYTKQRKIDDIIKVWREYRFQDPRNPVSYQEAADMLEKTSKFDDAVAEWKAFLATMPKNGVASNAMNYMARDLVLLKRGDEAKATYRAILAMDASGKYAPKELQASEAAGVQAERLAALRGLAELAQAENKPDEVIAAWQQVKTEQAPLAKKTGRYDPEPYAAIAKLYEQQKKMELAIAEYRALLDVVPLDADAYAQLGRIYEGQNKVEEAVAAYRKAQTFSKTPIQDGLKVAQAYQRFNQLDKALAEYQSLRMKAPTDVTVLTAYALALRQAGRDMESIEVYDALSKADPRLLWVSDYKALALTRLKRYPEARALYTAQLDRNAQSRQTYADLANVYREEGKPDDFLAWVQPRFEKSPANLVLIAVVLDEYIRQKRGDAGFAYVKGVVAQHKTQRPVLDAYANTLAGRGKPAEALEVYRQIAALAPKDLAVQLTLAEQLDQNSQKDEAAKLYQSLIARPELPAEQRLNLRRRFAQRCVLQGDRDEAIRQYTEIVTAHPKDYEAISELALTLVAAGRDKDALPYYLKLSTEATYSPDARADLFSKIGDIYARQNRKQDAITQYHEALKLNPRDTGAVEGLKRLGEK